jgi:apolipoprotein N-acyltransferase
VVRARDERDAPGVLHVTPAIRADPPTLYARLGDAPLAVLLALAGAAFAARRRTARPPLSPLSP